MAPPPFPPLLALPITDVSPPPLLPETHMVYPWRHWWRRILTSRPITLEYMVMLVICNPRSLAWFLRLKVAVDHRPNCADPASAPRKRKNAESHALFNRSDREIFVYIYYFSKEVSCWGRISWMDKEMICASSGRRWPEKSRPIAFARSGGVIDAPPRHTHTWFNKLSRAREILIFFSISVRLSYLPSAHLSFRGEKKKIARTGA